MNALFYRVATALVCLPLALSAAPLDDPARRAKRDEPPSAPHLKDEVVSSRGTLALAGKTLSYSAEAGILVVHVSDPQDADPAPATDKAAPLPPEAGMSYVAYFLGAQPDPARPITFLFNGGPGSSTVWLHMGAFGPKRVVTRDGSHSPAAPYALVENRSSLLPESDLVFIDAPGTGFGHLRGAEHDKAFWGVDEDAHAFANFIVEFLSRHGRWNSPKYVFGESYGTTRAGALSYLLASEKAIDLNGLILLSQSLSYDVSPDSAEQNPGIDQPYALYLPSFAATAWYHKKLATEPPELAPFLAEVESFALGEYWTALAAGSRLAPEKRAEIVKRLSAYTGLAPDYIERANLRITAGVFEQHVLGERTTGQLDARFSGPSIDLLAKEPGYDPQSAAISSAYVSAFNDYARRVLGVGGERSYRESAPVEDVWDFLHRPPGARSKIQQAVNVIPDLAFTMKANPRLKVQMNGGYFDLSTPYFAAEFELAHLPVPADVAANIEIKLYPSGHMVYVNEPSLVALHDNVADFIRRTHTAH